MSVRLRMGTAGLLLALSLGGCGGKPGPAATEAAAAADSALTVLAGSELKDIEPLLPAIEKATGLRLRLRYVGTLEAVEQLQSGAEYDFAWLASNRYAMLTPGARERIKASERTMLTPVVLGVKASKAKALGWDGAAQPSWAEIAAAAGAGKFKFAMSNPATSNTGFSAVLGLATAVSGKGDALEEGDIDRGRLTAFARAQALTAGSSGWLSDAYVRDQDRLDGMVNYASVLHRLNRDGALREKLVPIYPKDGIVTADYPLMLLDPKRRADYDTLLAYLKGEEFQKAMTQATLRRPVNPAVPSAVPVPGAFELPFPAKLAVVDAILEGFLNEFRRPADSTFVVDISGSMNGDRIEQLKQALIALSGADRSLSGRFSRFRDRELIGIVPFSDTVHDTASWRLNDDAAANRKQLDAVAAYARDLRTRGGTAIFSAVKTAYAEAAQRQKQEPERVYSLVVMTDGENHDGIGADEFRTWFESLPEAERRIRIFAVLFGDARSDELERLTQPTGGRVFDANEAGLTAVFKDIRGYQ